MPLPTADEFFGATGDTSAAPTAAAGAPPPEVAQHVDALIKHESGGNPNAVGDSGLALGLGQMHPEVRKAYNVRPDSTPEEQKAAVTSYFTDLWNKHHGNADEALSEYHLGAPNYSRDRSSPANLKYLEEHKKRLGGEASSTLPTADEFFGSEAPAPAPTSESGTSVTTTPISGTPPPTTSIGTADEEAKRFNATMGLREDHPVGTAIGEGSRALMDFLEGAEGITHPTGFADALNDVLKIAHPLTAGPEAAGKIVVDEMNRRGWDPKLSAAAGVVVSLGLGAATPLPGGGAGRAAEMPLQGSTATRLAAKEAESATAAATEAAAKVAPGAEAAAAAKGALAPAGVTAEQGGQAIATGLTKKLAEVKEPVQGIYRTVAESNADKVLDPSKAQSVVDGIAAVQEELGATLSGQPKQVLTSLKEKAAAGNATYADLEAYKSQLDTLLPGKTPMGATPKTGALYNLKWDLRNTMRDMVEGSDREWLDVANSMWRDQVIPKQKLVELVKKTDPQTVVERLFGNGASDKQAAMARTVMRELGDDPAGAGEAVRQAVFSRLIGKASNAEGDLDPKALMKSYDALNEGFRGAIANPGAEAFFKTLRKAHGTAEETAGAAKEVAKVAKGAAEPNTLAHFAARGIHIAATEALAKALGFPMAYGAAGIVIPTEGLARALANSKTANVLARSLKTPVNSAVVPTLLQQLKKAGVLPAPQKEAA